MASWDSAEDQWELYDLRSDFSQANDLAASEPEKLAKMEQDYLKIAEDNKDFPIGAGNWLRTHPEDRITTPYRSWTFNANTRRMPEFTAPGVGRESNHVTIDAEFGENANGVLYAVGGAGGGLSVYMHQGHLVYEYNMLIIDRYGIGTVAKLAPGRHRIEVETSIEKPGGPAEVILSVDGQEVTGTTVGRTVPVAFTATETFDVGLDLGSPVSMVYYDRRPFAFDGTIHKVEVTLK